jgi:hypothetical protein
VNSEDEAKLENEMNKSVHYFGLDGWKVIWVPDEKQKVGGQVLSEERTILVFEKDPEKVKDAFFHEILEIKLQPLIAEYQDAINALIKVIERLTYREKERVVKDIVPYLRYVFEDKKEG